MMAISWVRGHACISRGGLCKPGALYFTRSRTRTFSGWQRRLEPGNRCDRLWRPAVVIVLDSSFLIGFYNERDAHHAAASTLMDRFLAGTWGKGLLLEYIFLEITTVLMLRSERAHVCTPAP